MRTVATLLIATGSLLVAPLARAAPAAPTSQPASGPASQPASQPAKAAKAAKARPDKSDADDPRWCRACHTQARFARRHWLRGAHAEQTCRECHRAHAFNPHEKPKSFDDDPAVQAIKKAKLFKLDPVAAASCSECHDDVGVGEFFHGKASHRGKVRPGLGPWCPDCHGDAHTIRKAKSMKPRARREHMNERCLACHADKKRMKLAGITAPVAHSYHDSMHGRLLALGSTRAPGCVDCHGSHKLVPLTPKAMAARCKKCHHGATKAFATLVSHKPIKTRPASYYTQKFFAWLTFLTIFLLGLHVLIDLSSALRRNRHGS